MSQLTVAVLGTGIMGSAMARNIAGAGHAVRAWNCTISRAQTIDIQGVQVVFKIAISVPLEPTRRDICLQGIPPPAYG